MHKTKLLAGAAFLVAAWPAAAAEFDADSIIDRVTVYPSGATIVREAAINLPAGDHVVTIDDLPTNIDTSSLKVEGAGNVGIAIASVETRWIAADDIVDPARQTILDTIQDAQDRIAAIDDRIGALDGRRRFLERLIETTPTGFGAALSEGNGAIDQWTSAAVAIGDGLAEVAEAVRRANIERRALFSELERWQKELAVLPAPSGGVSVRIALAADTATDAALSLSYQTYAANWVPAYDAQLSTAEAGGKPSLAIVRRAEVTQSTGEDWSNVALTLSTMRTAGGTAAPTLGPTLVVIDQGYAYGADALEEVAAQTARPMPAPSLLDQMAALAPSGGEVAKFVEASASFGDFRADYVVPGRVSIDSGEGARAIQIATEAVPVRLEVRAVPMLADAAYLHAAFIPAEGAPLLPGRVALYRDGTFVGNGDLPLARAGREVNLGFGIDDRVRITRVALERKLGEHGILSSRKTDEQRFKITVDNLHSQPIEITVLDRMPYAEDEQVSVTRIGNGTEPTAVNVDDRRGVLAWTYTYEAGESREILTGYEVSWPGDKSVILTN